jgi:hypothetical protein
LLMTQRQDDPNGRARSEAFVQALQRLDWTGGHNVLIDYRWSGGDAESVRKEAVELVALMPDVILTQRRCGRRGVAPGHS